MPNLVFNPAISIADESMTANPGRSSQVKTEFLKNALSVREKSSSVAFANCIASGED